jgi:D-alanine-D-alanine ligase-like ATP-grasp enzyme
MHRLRLPYLKLARLYRLILKRVVRRQDGNRVYFHQRIAEYREAWHAASSAIGAEFTELTATTWQIERDGRRTRLVNYLTEFDNPVALSMAGNKPLIHRLLAQKGLPVPDHLVFSLPDIERAYRFLAAHPAGAVVKPAHGSAGLGVTTHVETRSDVRRAAVLASLYSPDILIEALIPGECYRLLVLEGKMIHAVCRRGRRLKGDGVSTVLQLASRASTDETARAERALRADRNIRFTLGWQGISLDSVVEAEREFMLKTIPNDRDNLVELRTVYNAVATDQIGDALRNAAEQAAEIVHSDFVGVDVITPDPSLPLEQAGGAINEVNTTPALHHHYEFLADRYPAPAPNVLEALLRRSPANGRQEG